MQIRSLSLTVLLAIVGTACKRQPAPEEQAPAPPSPSPQAVASATPKADTVGWGWDSRKPFGCLACNTLLQLESSASSVSRRPTISTASDRAIRSGRLSTASIGGLIWYRLSGVRTS